MRHAIRWASNGYIGLTNSYQALGSADGSAIGDLQRTSCSRLDRIHVLFGQGYPQSPADCLRYLSDPDIRMSITVQQMAFRALTGEHWIRMQ